jgi:hypothetical protein
LLNLIIFSNKKKLEKFIPIIISIIFGILSSYILFFHHPYFFEFDGIIYYETGLQILEGGGYNVKQFDTPIGGPVFFGIIDSLFHDGILTIKIITIFSGAGIVFFSFYIVKNIFSYRIALASQLLVVVNAQLLFQSSHLMNDIFPFFLITVTLYFATKSNLKLIDLVIIGVLLGISSMMRVYGILAFFSILLYLLIQQNKKRKKLLNFVIFSCIFLISFSPLIMYNYYTHDVFLDSNSTLFITRWHTFQTPEWHSAMELVVINEKSLDIFLDFPLFLKNYFYNLFFHNSSILFNFNSIDNISIIPIIPYIGMISVFGGFISCMNQTITKRNLLIIISVIGVASIIIGIFGDFQIHFMLMIFSPFIIFGILNIRKTKNNILPLLIFPLVFLFSISIVNLGRGYQFLPILISLTMFSSIFIFQTIPQIATKISSYKKTETKGKMLKITIIILAIIIFINIGYSFKVVQYSLYDNVLMPSLEEGIFGLFSQNEKIIPKGLEYKIIGDILVQQSGIKDSYVMSSHNGYSFYSNSKYLHTQFFEGETGSSINEFILREDWTDFQRFISNLHSIPMDRHNLVDPKPDYLIYEPQNHSNPYLSTERWEELEEILSVPNHQKIPDNFEVIYSSPQSETILYRINWD